MSKRTEEIKLRLTPQEKAAWQQAAESEQTTLSELIRKTMASLVWEQQNAPRSVYTADATAYPQCDCGRGGVCTGCARSAAKESHVLTKPWGTQPVATEIHETAKAPRWYGKSTVEQISEQHPTEVKTHPESEQALALRAAIPILPAETLEGVEVGPELQPGLCGECPDAKCNAVCATPPQTDVPTSGEVGAKEDGVFVIWPSVVDDESPPPERRTEPCECGKPSWLFCLRCDA